MLSLGSMEVYVSYRRRYITVALSTFERWRSSTIKVGQAANVTRLGLAWDLRGAVKGCVIG